MNEAIEYCVAKQREAQGLPPIVSFVELPNGDFNVFTADGDGPAGYQGTFTLDLDWWAQVPIDDWDKYRHEVSKIAGDPEAIVHNAPISVRCQALYEAEKE